MPRAILGLLLGAHSLSDAEADGLTYLGDPGLLERIAADGLPITSPG